MHRVVPGGRSQPYRKVGSSVYVVYRGKGSSIIEGQRFEWSRGDMFVVPSWATLEHEASEVSDLFAINNNCSISNLTDVYKINIIRSQYFKEII